MSVTKSSVKEKVRDWVARIESLYENIEKWASDCEKIDEIIRGETFQRREHLMEQFKVEPGKIPTLSLHSGKKRLSFVPSSLWNEGANGRINVMANNEHYILFDMGGENGSRSDWKISIPDARSSLTKFDKFSFKRIVKENL